MGKMARRMKREREIDRGKYKCVYKTVLRQRVCRVWNVPQERKNHQRDKERLQSLP